MNHTMSQEQQHQGERALASMVQRYRGQHPFDGILQTFLLCLKTMNEI
jgi:dGTP triphosphohydrolase